MSGSLGGSRHNVGSGGRGRLCRKECRVGTVLRVGRGWSWRHFGVTLGFRGRALAGKAKEADHTTSAEWRREGGRRGRAWGTPGLQTLGQGRRCRSVASKFAISSQGPPPAISGALVFHVTCPQPSLGPPGRGSGVGVRALDSPASSGGLCLGSGLGEPSVGNRPDLSASIATRIGARSVSFVLRPDALQFTPNAFCKILLTGCSLRPSRVQPHPPRPPTTSVPDCSIPCVIHAECPYVQG